MKKAFFKFVNKLNKVLLPKLSKKDPTGLTKFERALAAYKYYVLLQGSISFSVEDLGLSI